MSIYKQMDLPENPAIEELDTLLEELSNMELTPFQEFKYKFIKNLRNKLLDKK